MIEALGPEAVTGLISGGTTGAVIVATQRLHLKYLRESVDRLAEGFERLQQLAHATAGRVDIIEAMERLRKHEKTS